MGFYRLEWGNEQIFCGGGVENGCIVVPQNRGLGMELNWDELERRNMEVL